MTNEQAKSELMQIYGSLSEEKKMALDVLMAQADGEKTCGTCRNEDTYHCAECENKSDYEQSQADGEYISRTAIKYINAPIAPIIQGEEVHYEWVAFRNQIEQLPSVAIPNKVGHWIDDNENELDAQYGRHLYRCSKCDTYADDFVGGTEDWWDIKEPNFCPNCGCHMEIERVKHG